MMTAWAGREVIPRLIPYGKNAQEQQDILQTIAGEVIEGKVYFDVTHGFRHLSMVGFVSAFMLERLRNNLQVEVLWYGALDMAGRNANETNSAPVVELRGLTHVQLWVDALSRFDASGDYSVFSDLLIADGVAEEKAILLRAAAHFERASNLYGARIKIQNFLEILESPLPGSSEIFRKQLKKRLNWARNDSLAENQKKLASTYLERKDFIRAAQFGIEALFSTKCDELGLSAMDHDSRDKAKGLLQKPEHWSNIELRECYNLLNTLRNVMTHGSKSSWPRANQIMQDDNPDRLSWELKKIFGELL